jgi:hypothetical protein
MGEATAAFTAFLSSPRRRNFKAVAPRGFDLVTRAGNGIFAEKRKNFRLTPVDSVECTDVPPISVLHFAVSTRQPRIGVRKASRLGELSQKHVYCR